MKKLVNIKLHGVLGEEIKKEFNLAVKSVSEAVHAINTITKNKFYKTLYEFDKQNIKYHVLINQKAFFTENPHEEVTPEIALKSELVAINENLESIDIIPAIEGADDFLGIFQMILGVILILVGALAEGISGGLSTGLIMAGIGLLAGGVISLLTTPPKFEDFREIDGATGRTSYLFNGPENTTKEGGPVPVGYGRLLVGSQVISASYVVSDVDNGYYVTSALQNAAGGGGGGNKYAKITQVY